MTAVELVFHDDLAEITLNRPERKNALRGQDWSALADAALQVTASPARALLIRGAGDAFCSGFDIAEIEPDKTDALAIIDGLVNPALRALRDVPVPTLAAVTGACVGGGFGIAAACDITIAAESARFGAPYSNIGIMCDAGLHSFLRDTIGHQRAAFMIFTGKTIPSRAALDMGLCSDVLPDSDLQEGARALANRLATGPTAALRRSKHILRHVADPDAALDAEARLQAEVFATEDAREGISAFLSGRRPTFTGR